MTQHEVIQKINQAMCDDDLDAAEKALEEHSVCFMRWKGDSEWCEWNDYFIHATTEEEKTYEELYQLFINENEKSLNKQ